MTTLSRRKRRVLVVDDAVVIRRMVTDVLNADPDIEVVGTAANGRIALQKLTQVNPDLVTLDVEMPELDGMATLRAIRETHPRLPVIMFSTLTERGAAVTIDALSFGASDYVTKPANVGSVAAAQERIRTDLIPKIKALCGMQLEPSPQVSPRPSAPAARPTMPAPAFRLDGDIDLVTIGVSTGGPNALAVIIPALAADFPVPIALVQHMPPMFTRFLADRLAAQSKVAVVEARNGEEMQAGKVYIAPGDFHMTVSRHGHRFVAGLNQAPPENSCRPAADVLFRSVASAAGARALGVVLTGMGQDGLRGCEDICRAGGRVIVQDQATSVVWGMPGFVANAGLADRTLPLDQIAGEISRRTAKTRRAAVKVAG